jgi:hypothetical protein
MLTSIDTTLEQHLTLSKDLTVILIDEPQLRHQIEQCIDMRTKLHAQFNVGLAHVVVGHCFHIDRMSFFYHC